MCSVDILSAFAIALHHVGHRFSGSNVFVLQIFHVSFLTNLIRINASNSGNVVSELILRVEPVGNMAIIEQAMDH
jgi:hypothetical protein